MESVFDEAVALQKAGRLDEAEALYRRQLAGNAHWPSASNLAVILRITGRLEEAESLLRPLVAAHPEKPHLRHTLGMVLLQLGRYAEGWRFYEARHEITPRPQPPLPLWRGESLAGKRILVVTEQGLGDAILFSRFIPRLAELASEVSFAATRVMAPLLQHLPAKVAYPSGWDTFEADFWIQAGSVPRWLEAGPEDAPYPSIPLPHAPGPASGVGLMLGGGAGNPNARRLPGPGVAAAIRGLADFVDLAPEATGARDFSETAAIIAGLERVVSVDTSVAHLAGALGKPVTILLPRPAADWYAHWHDDRTPWHPSARLIRQRAPGDWAGVIADLSAALSAPPPV